MKFEIVSHACASVESRGVRLVIDPWLNGPVYWGAWWHCPAPVFDEALYKADYVYITHWHFDHMHEESLRHFDRSCHMLVPKFPVSIMAEGLRALGFQNVTELDHGVPMALAEGFDFTSYQVSYQDDSVAVIESEGVVIVDLNDSKPLTRAWKTFRDRYPTVDFMFRSHSPAWSYPSAYTFEVPEEAIPVTRESYVEAFHSAAEVLKPRYAVPFASGVCHPHPDLIEDNADVVSAFELKDYIDAHPLSQTELVIMPHGSSWDSEAGFSIDMNDAVRDASAYVAEHAHESKAYFEQLAQEESEVTLEFSLFETYFRDFLRSMMLPVRPFLNITWAFEVEQGGRTEYWSVAFRSGKIGRHERAPDEATSVIRAPVAVLDDAFKTSVFTNIDISKRWQVHVRRGGVTRHMLACVLVALHEAGYTKLSNVLSWRFFRGIFARRAEAMDYLALSFNVLRSGPGSVAKAVTELD